MKTSKKRPKRCNRHCGNTIAPGFSYHLQVPPGGAFGRPVLVAVHGISHRAKEQLRAFADFAGRKNFVLVAPLFGRKHFPAYQRLGVSDKPVPCYPDLALNRLLEELGGRTGADTGKVYLFGYSAGGQFVHRYAMAYPEKVRAVAMGSAGWYTFPDPQAPFPRGLRLRPGSRLPELDPSRFLKIPMAVFVGERDVESDATFKRSPRLDLQQGSTRVERARRWAQAMRTAARLHGFDTAYPCHLLAGCGHSFADCVSHGKLAEKAIDFLFSHAGKQRTAPSQPPVNFRPARRIA